MLLRTVVVASATALLVAATSSRQGQPGANAIAGTGPYPSFSWVPRAEGQEVEFEVKTGDKGLHAANVTRG